MRKRLQHVCRCDSLLHSIWSEGRKVNPLHCLLFLSNHSTGCCKYHKLSIFKNNQEIHIFCENMSDFRLQRSRDLVDDVTTCAKCMLSHRQLDPLCVAEPHECPMRGDEYAECSQFLSHIFKPVKIGRLCYCMSVACRIQAKIHAGEPSG